MRPEANEGSIAELFLDRVRVHWNIAPVPSFESIMGDDIAGLDRDTEGLEPERRSIVRDTAFHQRLSQMASFGPAITDDVGTVYRPSGGHASRAGLGEEWFGSRDFVPPLQEAHPSSSSELVRRNVECLC